MQLNTVLYVLTSLASLAAAQDTSLSTVKKAFDDANIPTDIQIRFNPNVLFEVTFPEPSSPPIQVHAGVQLPRNVTAGPPTFSVRSSGSFTAKGPFVVAAVDPDAPTPQNPTNAQIRHFLGGNFHLVAGSRDIRNLVNSTAALSNFQQPTPPAGSDPHRYVFLLFEQPARFNQQKLVNATTSISNFNISQFAADVGLGNPIGGTFIRVGPDPSATL